MTGFLFVLIVILFVWMLNIHNKTTDLTNEIKFLHSRIKGMEKHLSTHSVNKEISIPQAIEETVENEENSFIDDTGIEDNSGITEEQTEQTSDFIDNREYNGNNIENKIPHTLETKRNDDFEHVFLGKISSVIGAIAIIIGFAIFIGLIQGALSPLFKAIFALFVGIGIIICGLCIKKDSLIKYSEALTGTGFAIIFITLYCATMVVHTFSNLTCIILGIITLISAYLVANKQKTLSMIAIALTGGYFNVFMATPELSSNTLFIYLIFLNILSMAFVAKNPEKNIINIINLILTCLFATGFMYGQESQIDFIYPLILWAIYQIYDIVIKHKHSQFEGNNVLHWLNYLVLTVFSAVIFKDIVQIGTVQMYLAIPYCLILGIYIAKNSDKYFVYLNNLLLCILAAITLMANGCLRVGLLSLGAIILALIVNKLEREYLVRWSTGFLSAAVISTFIMNKDMFYLFDSDNYHPIFNLRTLALVSTILASFVCYIEFKAAKSELCNRLSQYMKFCSLTLIYILISFEIGDYIQYLTKEESSALFVSLMTYAIIWCVYSLQMKKMHSITNLTIFNAAFYTAGVISLMILLMGGLSYNPISAFIPIFNLRFMAFMTVIGASAYIAKTENKDFYKYLAVILGFIMLSAETNDFTKHINAADMNYLMSIVWILYSGILLAVGIFKDKKYFKMTGIWITILTVLKILFVDMAHVNFIYKMIVFVLLGAVLMMVSYYYNKLQK